MAYDDPASLLITGTVDGINRVESILKKIKTHGDTGHSFSIECSEGCETKNGKKVFLGDWDGDGASRMEIGEVKTGMEASKKAHKHIKVVCQECECVMQNCRCSKGQREIVKSICKNCKLENELLHTDDLSSRIANQLVFKRAYGHAMDFFKTRKGKTAILDILIESVELFVVRLDALITVDDEEIKKVMFSNDEVNLSVQLNLVYKTDFEKYLSSNGIDRYARDYAKFLKAFEDSVSKSDIKFLLSEFKDLSVDIDTSCKFTHEGNKYNLKGLTGFEYTAIFQGIEKESLFLKPRNASFTRNMDLESLKEEIGS